MKHKVWTVLLALGVSAGVFCTGVSAAETETAEAVAETETKAETEAESSVADSEGAEETEESKESGTEAEVGSEAAEAAEADSGSAEEESGTETEAETESTEDQMISFLTYYLQQVDSWTEEEVETLADGTDAAALIALNWEAVQGELGDFVKVTDAELSQTENAVIGHAEYSDAGDSATVTVTLSYSVDSSYSMTIDSIEWDVSYPMGVQMQRAALNTVMGIGIVFLALLFLSWVIGRLHYIPDLIESRRKQNEPEPAAVPAAPFVPAQEPEPIVEEISPADDLELVAVITAAIAASEGKASADGYVVRSIRRINKNNWRRA